MGTNATQRSPRKQPGRRPSLGERGRRLTARGERWRKAGSSVGDALLWLSLAGALFIVFGAVAPFNRIGIWLQSEPVITGRLLAASIGAIGILVLVVARRDGILDSLRHPLVLLVLAWAAWGLVTLPFATSPLLSAFGSPELGEGVLAQLSLALFIAAFLHARRDDRARRVFGLLALVAIALTAFMTLSQSAAWMPFYFKDFLAFYGIYFWVIARTWFERQTAWTILGAALGAVAILAAADNRTAWVAAILAASLCGALYLAVRRFGPDRTRSLAALAVAALPVAITLAIVAGPRFGLATPDQGSAAMTVVSRAILIDVVTEAIRADPSIALTGAGWGHFTELLLGYMPGAGVNVDLHPLGQGYFWDATWRGDFHSHNAFVEALVGGGVPGLLFALAFVAAIPFFAAPRHRILAAGLAAYLAVLGTAWFEMPTSLPMLAMALAGVAADPTPSPDSGRERAYRRLTAPLVALAGVSIAATVVSLTLAVDGRREAEINLNGSDDRGQASCAPVLRDYGRGPAHFSWLLRHQIENLVARLRQGETVEPWMVARVARYLCVADARGASDRSRRLAVDRVLVRSEIAFAPIPPALAGFRDGALAGWPDAVTTVLARAPARTDLLAPYFFWLLDKGEEREILRLTDRILGRRPNDAVALWFSGVVLLDAPATQALGLARLKSALAARIERVFPVADDLKRRILKSVPAHSDEPSTE